MNGRVIDLDVPALAEALAAGGCARLPELLGRDDCAALRSMYDDDERFRSTVDMARHGFGSGQYRYFRDPLPAAVAALRTQLYRPLATIANAWHRLLAHPDTFPATHEDFRRQCRDAGQSRPTCLLLRYRAGDYNCLHQDLYGPVVFPLQVVVALSEPGEDYDGGELVLVEQRPRMQSRARVLTMRRGDAAVIATHHLPRAGKRGLCRATLRHGVSEVRRGERWTLGIIFHDAA